MRSVQMPATEGTTDETARVGSVKRDTGNKVDKKKDAAISPFGVLGTL